MTGAVTGAKGKVAPEAGSSAARRASAGLAVHQHAAAAAHGDVQRAVVQQDPVDRHGIRARSSDGGSEVRVETPVRTQVGETRPRGAVDRREPPAEEQTAGAVGFHVANLAVDERQTARHRAVGRREHVHRTQSVRTRRDARERASDEQRVAQRGARADRPHSWNPVEPHLRPRLPAQSRRRPGEQPGGGHHRESTIGLCRMRELLAREGRTLVCCGR